MNASKTSGLDCRSRHSSERQLAIEEHQKHKRAIKCFLRLALVIVGLEGKVKKTTLNAITKGCLSTKSRHS